MEGCVGLRAGWGGGLDGAEGWMGLRAGWG